VGTRNGNASQQSQGSQSCGCQVANHGRLLVEETKGVRAGRRDSGQQQTESSTTIVVVEAIARQPPPGIFGKAGTTAW
jgi:hypothetical protein